MYRNWVTRPLLVFTLGLAALVAGFATLHAAEEAESGTKARRLRLPNYFAKVVDDEQRAKIHDIQLEYASQIEAKRAELEALVDERDTAIDKVLTPAQRKEVERLRAAAVAKRKGGTEDESAAKDADTKPKKSKSKAKKAA